MFKDTFTIKKTAYHVKMMKYIWGFKHTDFSHVCPYFWLSVLNHFIFIFWFPLKEGVKLIGTIFSLIYGFLSRRIDKIMKEYNRKAEIRYLAKEKIRVERERIKTEKWKAQMEANWLLYKDKPEEIAKKPELKGSLFNWLRDYHYESYHEMRVAVNKAADKLEKQQWVMEMELAAKQAAEYLAKKKAAFLSEYKAKDAQDIIARGDFEEYYTNWKNQKTQREIEAEAARRRATKDKINKILRITKPIMTLFAYTLGACLAVVIAYYLFIGVSNIIDWFGSIKHKNWVSVGKWSGYFGIGIIIIAAVFGLAFLLATLHKKWMDKRYEKRLKRYREEQDVLQTNGHYKALVSSKKKREYKALNNTVGFIANAGILIGKFFVWIWKNLFVKPAKKVASAFKFLYMMFKSHCPKLVWIGKDENE